MCNVSGCEATREVSPIVFKHRCGDSLLVIREDNTFSGYRLSGQWMDFQIIAYGEAMSEEDIRNLFGAFVSPNLTYYAN
jgi:hypothetical protein